MKYLAHSSLLALTALLAAAPLAAHAQLSAQLSSEPGGDATLLASGSYSSYASATRSGTYVAPTTDGDMVTFADTVNGVHAYANSAGIDAFPGGATLLTTVVHGGQAPAPLTISFADGVQSFGVMAQDNAIDTETFSFSVFDGATLLGSYTAGPADNTSAVGQALFLGAQAAKGFDITSVSISSLPSAGPVNNFSIGSVAVAAAAPAPETGSAAGFGVLLAAGALTLLRKRSHRAA